MSTYTWRVKVEVLDETNTVVETFEGYDISDNAFYAVNDFIESYIKDNLEVICDA